MEKKYPCPCCGKIAFRIERDYEICNTCMWEDDPDQFDDPTDELGANMLCLNDYREDWLKKQKQSA